MINDVWPVPGPSNLAIINYMDELLIDWLMNLYCIIDFIIWLDYSFFDIDLNQIDTKL